MPVGREAPVGTARRDGPRLGRSGARGGQKMAYDLLIKNGCVVDGSGEPAFNADVAVQDGKIVGVGKSNGAAAKRTIDAAGRVVAPGFIDHHTHFDPQAVWDPYCGSWVHNGHTTVVVGQCVRVMPSGISNSSPTPSRSRCRC